MLIHTGLQESFKVQLAQLKKKAINSDNPLKSISKLPDSVKI